MDAANDSGCPLCRSADAEVVYDLRRVADASCVPGYIVRCRACGMWFKRIVGLESLNEVYGDAYAEVAQAGTYMEGSTTRAFFEKVLGRAKTAAHGRAPRLLDVGAGAGSLLEVARDMGFEVEGIELSPALAARARERGFDVRCIAAEQLDAVARYDVITLMDLIEHVPDPLGVLRTTLRALRPGGELVVYTPNHDGAVVVLAKALAALGLDFAVREIFGRNHVCFFDARSLTRALELAGFSVRRTWRFPYDPRRPGQPVSLANRAAVGVVEWLGYPFGRVFRIVAHARRPADAGASA